MKRLIAVIALMALALPVAAQEDEPQVLDLETKDYGSPIGERLVVVNWSHGESHPVHWGVVGHFLWLEWGNSGREADSQSGNHVSIDISDLTIRQVIAYPDGTVDIIRETPEPEPTPEPETVDVVEEFPSINWPRLVPAGVRPL